MPARLQRAPEWPRVSGCGSQSHDPPSRPQDPHGATNQSLKCLLILFKKAKSMKATLMSYFPSSPRWKLTNAQWTGREAGQERARTIGEPQSHPHGGPCREGRPRGLALPLSNSEAFHSYPENLRKQRSVQKRKGPGTPAPPAHIWESTPVFPTSTQGHTSYARGTANQNAGSFYLPHFSTSTFSSHTVLLNEQRFGGNTGITTDECSSQLT